MNGDNDISRLVSCLEILVGFVRRAKMMRAALCLLAMAAATAGSSPYNVHWSSPKEFGVNEAGQQTYYSGMPVGNGDLVALVWPNMSAGGLQMYVRKADAMSSQTELFTIASVQVVLGCFALLMYIRSC